MCQNLVWRSCKQFTHTHIIYTLTCISVWLWPFITFASTHTLTYPDIHQTDTTDELCQIEYSICTLHKGRADRRCLYIKQGKVHPNKYKALKHFKSVLDCKTSNDSHLHKLEFNTQPKTHSYIGKHKHKQVFSQC